MRHILGLSGGKDSTALAILMHTKIPQMEYFFCDTGKELPETYEYLDRIKARLGIKIEYLNADQGFDYWLKVYGGFLPSPKMRWCTRQLKLAPLEKYVGDDEAISYVAIRADENRDGYVSTKPNLTAVFPFRELGYDKAKVLQLLEESGIGLPQYYRWRTRSGCTFCFFQRRYEWVMLAQEHPQEFAEAVSYEKENADGRRYTWVQGETLLELLARKDEIIANHEAVMKRELRAAPNLPLGIVFANALEEEEENEEIPCTMCHK